MTWLSLPLVPADPLAYWPNISQFWRAARERQIAAGGGERWPQHSTPWSSGTVTTITDNEDGTFTIYDATKAAATGTDGPNLWSNGTRSECYGGPSAPYWTGVTRTDSDCVQLPSTYDVVIEVGGTGGTLHDERKAVRGTITANTSQTLTIGGAGITNAVVAGFIASVAACEGRPYFIVRQGGPWWSDRWPEFPNDQEAWKGVDSQGVTVVTVPEALIDYAGKTLRVASTDYTILATSTTQVVIDGLTSALTGSYEIKDGATVLVSGTIGACASGIYQTAVDWPAAALVDLELMIYSGAMLKRVTITGNAANWATFAQADWVADGIYIVVAPGAIAMPGRHSMPVAAWYRGIHRAWYSIYPQDSIQSNELESSTKMPAPTQELAAGEECADTVNVTAFDTDVWTLIDEICNPADFNYSPNLYKTFRQLQVWVEETCGAFVKPVSYAGATAIPYFTFATLMHYLGINAWSQTASVSSGSATFDVSAQVLYDGCPIHVTIHDHTGGILSESYPVAYDAETGIVSVSSASALNGKTLTLYGTRGWTRHMPRRVRDPYARTAFIPDLDPLAEEGPEPVDPPSIGDFEETGCSGVGAWVRREASAERLNYGDTGFATEGGPLTENKLHRYVGDNWNDPPVWLGEPVEEEADLIAPYRKRFYAGNLSQLGDNPPQRQYEAGRSGTATGGTTYYLEDTSKNWWDGIYGSGTLKTHNGTASGGSSTTLEDDTIHDDEASGCWFKSDRFTGFDAPMKGFILEVPRTVGEDTVTYRAPIDAADVDGTRLEFTVSAPWGITVADGDVWQVREPSYSLNRWEGRTLRLTKPDGTVIEAVVTANDDKRIYFEAIGESVAEGWTYQIVELKPGGVYRRTEEPLGTNAAWEAPEGEDPRGATFRTDVTANLPDKLTQFGRMRKGDYFAAHILNELYQAINALRWTLHPVVWDNSDTQEPREPYANGGSAGSEGTYETWYSTTGILNDTNTFIASAGPITLSEGSPSRPYAKSRGEHTGSRNILVCGGTTTSDDYTGYWGGFLSQNVATAWAFNVPTALASNATFWAKAVNPNLFFIDGQWVEDFVGPLPSEPEIYANYQTQFDDLGQGITENWSPIGSEMGTTSTRKGNRVSGEPIVPGPALVGVGPAIIVLDEYDDCVFSGNPGEAIAANGFEVVAELVILQWDVEGGFVYVD